MKRRRFGRWSLLGVALAAIALAAVPATAASAVTVKKLRFKGSPAESVSAQFPVVVLEADRRGRFGVTFTAANDGRRPTGRTAAVVFVSGRKAGTASIPPLRPGRHTTVQESFVRRFQGSGEYAAQVCVQGSCTRRDPFSAVPRTWFVDNFTAGPHSFSGNPPLFEAQAGPMTFDFYGTVNSPDGPFHLWLADGTVRGQTSGSYSNCTYSGSGSATHSPWDVLGESTGYLEVTTELNGYFAEIEDTDEQHAYTVTQACNWGTNETPTTIERLETLNQDTAGPDYNDMDPQATTLQGSYDIQSGFGGGVEGAWTFSADLVP